MSTIEAVKKWSALALLTAAVVAVAPPPAAAAPTIPLYLNGRPLVLPTPGVLADGRLLVPLRGFVEAMGGEIQWTPPGHITARLGERTVALTVGSREAQAAGTTITLDVPPRLIDDRTFIPVRFVSEGLGAAVRYDGSIVNVIPPAARRLVVADGPLNVRAQPSTGAAILAAAPKGTRLDLLQESGAWARIRLPNGVSGWVATQYTAPAASGAAPRPEGQLLAGETAYLEFQGQCLGASPLLDGKLYAPVYPVVERLGGQVGWDGSTITLRYGGREVQLTPGLAGARVGGAPVSLEGAPVIAGSELFLPARTLGDWLGLTLRWDGARRTASLTGPGPASPVREACNPTISAGSYLVMDAETGVVLSAREAGVAVPIASTTKIMTALLALERARMDQVVTVSPRAAAMEGTRMELRRWQQVSMRDLLYGLMLPSGNDAAAAIAEHLAGTETIFAQQMTARAAALGARNTLFYNASGLDDYATPFSTAEDLARITRHALLNPTFRTIVSTPEYRFGIRVLLGRNDFALKYPGATGVKNGWTEKAGHTLVASAQRDGLELIVVVLGAPSRDALYRTAFDLMDRGFALRSQSWLLGTPR